MVDVTSILFTFGALIAGFAAAAFIAKITGTSGFIIAAITEFLDIVKRTFQFVVDHLPKSVRMVLFILLFALIGGGIYSLTLGAVYVCYDDNVHKVDYITGLASKLSGGQSAAADYFEVERSDFYNMGCESDGTDCVAESISEEQKEYILKGENNLIGVVTGYEIPEEGTYDLTYTIKPLAAINGLSGWEGSSIIKLSLESREYAFTNFFGTAEQRYDICYSSAQETCMLVQNNNKLVNDACSYLDNLGPLLTFYQDDVELKDVFNEGGLWNENVGSIIYYLKTDDKGDLLDIEDAVHAEVYGKTLNAFGDLLNIIALASFERHEITDCGIVSSEDKAVASSALTIIYNHGPFELEAKTASGQNFKVPIYNAGQDVLMAKKVQGENTEYFVDNREKGYTRAKEATVLELERTLVDNRDNVVKYYCDESTEESSDTYMTVMGLNPFDKTVMLLFVILGMIISIYGYFGVMQR